MQMQMPNARATQNMPPPQSWGPPPQAFPMGTGGPGYGPNPTYMPPPRQFDNYYPAGEMAPVDKPPRQGPPAYARDASMGTHTTNLQSQQSMVTKVNLLFPDLSVFHFEDRLVFHACILFWSILDKPPYRISKSHKMDRK